MIFDTHVHYDDEAFDQDREEIFCKLKEDGIDYVVNIGANMASSRKTVELTEKYEFCYGAVGVHPSDGQEICEDSLKELKELSQHDKIVAIGEIGLDYYWPEPSKEIQRNALEAQIALAKKSGSSHCDTQPGGSERDGRYVICSSCRGLRRCDPLFFLHKGNGKRIFKYGILHRCRWSCHF
jgi:Tat protein secretion system quality control protein TatD with DNase activity